MQNHY